MPFLRLLVDMDDTLLVEVDSALYSFRAAARRLGALFPGIDEEAFVSAVRACAREEWHALPSYGYAHRIGISSWEGLWAEFGDGDEGQRALKSLKTGYRQATWSNALARFGIHDPDLAFELSGIYVDTRRSRHILFPDALPFLDLVSKPPFSIALLTNGSPDLQRLKFRSSGLGAYFKDVFVSGEVGFRKPDRRIFDFCLGALSWKAEDTLMIGDSLHSDVAGASGAGIRSLWIDRKGEPAEAGIVPDFRAASLLEALEIIA